MDKTLIITGAAGFIGINFLKRFVKDKPKEFGRVIAIDKMGYATTYNKALYEDICRKNNIYKVDTSIKNLYQNGGLYFNSDEKVIVIDFASESHVDRSISSPIEIFEENSTIPAYLLQMIPKNSKYFHISTDEIYGQIPLDKIDNKDNWFTTSTQYHPSNPYSASKLAQDAYLLSMIHTYNYPIKILRLANQVGPHQHPEKYIPASIKRILDGETIKIYGNGSNMRQWTFVETTADIIYDIITSDRPAQDIPTVTHIADEKCLYNNNFIAQTLLKLLGAKGIYGKIEYIEDRKGHDSAYALSVDSIISSRYTKNIYEILNTTTDFYINLFKEPKE